MKYGDDLSGSVGNNQSCLIYRHVRGSDACLWLMTFIGMIAEGEYLIPNSVFLTLTISVFRHFRCLESFSPGVWMLNTPNAHSSYIIKMHIKQ